MTIKIMDCTLRDGGYKNNWKFSSQQIINIITLLNSAKIEYVECGYLTFGTEKNTVSTKFPSLKGFNNLISEIAFSIKSELFLMIDFDITNEINLPDKNSDNQYLDGFRLAFHKQDFSRITNIIDNILNKGYKLWLQPMLTHVYSDYEILQLIDLINDKGLETFYIVDSFGNINFSEINRIFFLIDKHLRHSVSIGFHPHNNLQMAFANSIELMNINSKRKIIIDSTVSGIGRGAGNLNTEIIINHLNSNKFKNYDLIPVLQIIDEILSKIFPDRDFKKSTAYYLAAKRGCHPGYPDFFSSMDFLTITKINNLIDNIDEQHLDFFNRDYAGTLIGGKNG